MSVPEYRVCDCGINPVTKSSGVSIISTSELERVRYKGLQTCGSVWHCPVCASRISYYRAREIRYMCDMWQKTGGGVIFITNTIRHGLGDDLRILLEVLFGIVWNRYINHRGYKTAREKLGYIGRVRAVEVTVGSNGWHPHVHEIWLIEKPLTSSELDDVKRQLYKVWNATLKHAGMKPVTPENGVTVQNGDNAAEYVSKFGTMPKWDMSTELTKSHMKRGRGNSMTPFDLLRASFAGDERASQLFVEYAIAFHGRHQIQFSTGLKKYFCIDERTDDQIAASNDDEIMTLALLTNEEWRRVVLYGDRAILLCIAEKGGAAAVAEYLSNLPRTL